MSALALILGRAESKGVPGKNMALLGGRPCVCWSIDHAREAQHVARIAISTDDVSMQQLGVDLGIDVVARPAALARDDTPVDDAARHALETLGWSDGPVVLLYANVPVRPSGLIDEAVDMLERTGCDSVQSLAPVGKYHPWWTATLDVSSGSILPWTGDTLNNNVFRRQDLPAAFIPDGGVLACRVEALQLKIRSVSPGPHAFLGRDKRGIQTKIGDVVDIDSPIDLLVAEALLRGDHLASLNPLMP